MLKVSRYVVESRGFYDETHNAACKIIMSTRSLRTFLLTEKLWNQVQRGLLEDCASDVIATLENASILVPFATDELRNILEQSRAVASETDVLYECIQPTSFCNFSCGYCSQDHSASRLSKRDQSLLLQRVDRKLSTGHYKALRVGWFGGEPLAAVPTLRSLSSGLKASAKLHECRYTAHIVTNGFALVPGLANELVHDHGIDEFEITLDGPAEVHDRRRATARGGKTYDVIYSRLTALLALDLPCKIVLRCNVDARNADAVPELIKDVGRLKPGKNFRLYFAPVHDWGNDASRDALPPKAFARLEVDWFAQMLGEGLGVALLPSLKPLVCMAVNPHSELIDPSGQIFNCTEVSLLPAYADNNPYAKGTIDAPSGSELAERLSMFLEDVGAGLFGCSSCSMLPVCGGACPKSWYDGTPPCPSTKYNLPERLLLAVNGMPREKPDAQIGLSA